MKRGGSDVHIVSPRLVASGWEWTCSCGDHRAVMRPSTSDAKYRLAAVDAAAHHGSAAHPGVWQLGADLIDAPMVKKPA